MKNLYINRKIINLLLLFGIVLFQMEGKAQATVYVNPDTTVISGQSTVTVDFMISDVINLHSYKVSFLFNNSKISFQSIVKGPFLSSGGSTAFFTTPSTIVDSTNVEEAILGPYSVSGSGILFSITFNVESAGTSSINIVDVQLRDLANQSIPVTWTSGEIIVPLSVNIKFFLQGPFNVSIMDTNLNFLGHLPITQPYSVPPWNYSGTESVSSGFFNTHPNIVDWVLIELRTGRNSSSFVERKAGFVLNTGIITGVDGISPLYFNQFAGNYSIVIYHRNHIPIMSSSSAFLDYISSQYDFTDSQFKAYGINSMVNLGGGYYGFPAGDSDGSGTVNAADRSNTWNQRNLSGYFGTDVDLSGAVNAADRSIIWNNRNITTQVPD